MNQTQQTVIREADNLEALALDHGTEAAVIAIQLSRIPERAHDDVVITAIRLRALISNHGAAALMAAVSEASHQLKHDGQEIPPVDVTTFDPCGYAAASDEPAMNDATRSALNRLMTGSAMPEVRALAKTLIEKHTTAPAEEEEAEDFIEQRRRLVV